MELPSLFTEQMHALLGENYPEYQDSFRRLPAKGIRVNELKISPEDFCSLWEALGLPALRPIPWVHDGFFCPADVMPAKLPLFEAGLFYISDPSAMAPAEFLPVRPGDRVLDLCASPGGKTVELAAKMKGRGILYANDISASRAKVLRKNIERFGITNAFVTAERPEKLAAVFPAAFDKILVDAPCSGEGMFRSQPSMVRYWEEHGPSAYVPVQKEILECAYAMLAPGGSLVYSTCTFSPVEDEDQVLAFLDRHRDMSAVPLPECEGFSHLEREGSELPFVRFYPHQVEGEGQFAALMKKSGAISTHAQKAPYVWIKGDEEYLLPEAHEPYGGLHYLLTGLHRGTHGKYGFEPSEAYAMAQSTAGWPDVLALNWSDTRVMSYLRGETILLHEEEILLKEKKKKKEKGKKEKSYTLVTAGGFPLGFGLRNGVRLKNLRPPGWTYV